MKRMIIATVILIITVLVFIVSYALVVMPLEYTTDALSDTYSTLGFDDTAEVTGLMTNFPYFLAGGVIFGIFLVFIWYFAYAQKKEYEQD